MEEAIIELEKPKRVRKPKQFPPFYVLNKNEGELNENINVRHLFTIEDRDWNDYDENYPNGIEASPYSSFIPLHYLFMGQFPFTYYNEFRGKSNTDRELLNIQIGKQRTISGLLKQMLCLPVEINDVINNYLFYDRSINIDVLQNYMNHTSYIDSGTESFQGIGMSYYLRQRSYSSLVFPYSLYKRGQNSGFVPEIMAVVLPENYIYQKLHIVLHGTIDMSKIVVLVNRELDSTGYIHKPFRASYKKNFEPLLKQIKADVWKVDQKWMIDNCFIPKFKIEERNIFKRKERIKELIQQFLNSAPKIEEGRNISVNIDSIPLPFEPILNLSSGTTRTITIPNSDNWTYTIGTDPFRQEGDVVEYQSHTELFERRVRDESERLAALYNSPILEENRGNVSRSYDTGDIIEDNEPF